MTTKLRAASFQDGAVTTAKIAASAITNAKIADDAIQTENIASTVNLGRRNIVINGAMQISQRIGTTATAITGGNYGLDRWGMYYSGNSFTTQQVTDAPAGFYNSMKLTVTGTSTPTYSFFGQRIEGVNVNHIGLGTANCKSFTVSFYVKSSVAGVYSISMTNGAGDLAYPVQYTIDSANTWERKSMTIPPITSGTWVRDTTNGLYLRMNLGSPGSRTAAANGWRSGNFDGADGSTGAVTWATTSSATFFMTGCQIEVGSDVTEFEHRPYGEELSLCQRYFEKVSTTINYHLLIAGQCFSGTGLQFHYPFKVVKRGSASFTFSAAGTFTAVTSNGSNTGAGTNISATSTTDKEMRGTLTVSSGLSAGDASVLSHFGGQSDEAAVNIDAEL